MDEVLKLLMDEDLNGIKEWMSEVPEVLDEPDRFGFSLIENAIDCSSLEIIEFLINAGANVAYPPNIGYTSLHSAIERDKPDRERIVRLLVKNGADIDAHGVNDWTPLHMAAARGELELVKLLVELGADVKIRTRIDDYATAAEEARNFGEKETAEYLFSLQG